MKFFILTCALFLYACTNKPPEAKLTPVKLVTAVGLEKKPITFEIPPIPGAYQWSCRPENNILSKWKGKDWVNVNTTIKPSIYSSHFLDGEFKAEVVRTDEGCDIVSCVAAETVLSFDLTEYEKVGEKLNPASKGTPQMVPDYKSNLLSGRFKVMYAYYTDSKCTEPAIQEFQFEVD